MIVLSKYGCAPLAQVLSFHLSSFVNQAVNSPNCPPSNSGTIKFYNCARLQVSSWQFQHVTLYKLLTREADAFMVGRIHGIDIEHKEQIHYFAMTDDSLVANLRRSHS